MKEKSGSVKENRFVFGTSTEIPGFAPEPSPRFVCQIISPIFKCRPISWPIVSRLWIKKLPKRTKTKINRKRFDLFKDLRFSEWESHSLGTLSNLNWKLRKHNNGFAIALFFKKFHIASFGDK